MKTSLKGDGKEKQTREKQEKCQSENNLEKKSRLITVCHCNVTRLILTALR